VYHYIPTIIVAQNIFKEILKKSNIR
jgi:hypothetical protein